MAALRERGQGPMGCTYEDEDTGELAFTVYVSSSAYYLPVA